MDITESKATRFTFATKRLFASSLLHLSRLLEEETWQLAKQPPTWQILAHALKWADAPWISPLPETSKTWIPVFRESGTSKFSYKSTRDNLIELYNKKKNDPTLSTTQAIDAGAKFLREHFTATSVRDLNGLVQFYYSSISRRKPEDWWDRLPIFAPQAKHKAPHKFLEYAAVNRGGNTANYAIRSVSFFLDLLVKKVEEFTKIIPAETHYSSSSDVKTSQLFSLSGAISLKPEGREQLIERANLISSNLVTAVPYAEQQNPEFIYDYVLKNLNAELLHQTHRHFGRLQQSLFGDLVMAEFPIFFWHYLSGDAKAADNLPEGRRTEFTPAECAAVFRELSNIYTGFREVSSRENHTEDPLWSHTIYRSTIKKRAGELCFEHINALKLIEWISELPRILNRPDAANHLDGNTIEQAHILVKDFQKRADEIHSFLTILYTHNRGLCGILAGNFYSKNSSYSAQDRENVSSMVKDEMLKTVASFNFSTGNRFSTYAYNRINMELRRKPHQERQVIKLSPDLTTAQPRVYHLSLESDLLSSDPNYFVDISERYNAQYGGKGKLSLSSAEVADLLHVSKTQSLSVQKPDDTETSTLDLDWATHTQNPITSSQLDEAAIEIRAILDQNFSAAEELALAVLIQATPANLALKRFAAYELSQTKTRIQRLISSHAKKSPNGHSLRLTPGSQTQRVILTRQSEEKAQNELQDD